MATTTRAPLASSVADDGVSQPTVDWATLYGDQSGAAPLAAAPAATLSQASAAAPVAAGALQVPAPFARGDVVVYRVGEGSAPLASTGTAVFLDEYSPTGTLVQSIALPTAVNGTSRRLEAAGTQAEGFLTRTSDGHTLLIPGYDVATGGTVLTSTNARVIGLAAPDGTVDTTHYLTDLGSGNFRSVAGDTAAAVYTATAANGIHYSAIASTTSTLVVTTPSNFRAVGIFAGQLYDSAMTGTFRVSTVGTGEPTTTGNTVTNLPGVETATATSPYAFFFADLSSTVAGVDTLYVADDAPKASGGGINKYSLVGGTWVSNGTIDDAGVRGLTGTVSGGSVTLFATTNGSLDSLVDTSGYNGALTASLYHLANAGANTAFRGVAFAPVATTALTISNASVTEGNSGTTPITFTVTRDTVLGAATVDYAVTFGTGAGQASAADFSALTATGTLSFANGVASQTITLNVTGDTTFESNETFSVVLSNASAGNTIVTGTGLGTIANDDARPTLAIDSVTHDEGNGGTTAYTFTVTLTGASALTTTVDYSVANGTTDSTDFATALPAGTLTFAPGTTTQQVTVSVQGDTTYEPDETFAVTLANPVNATVATATGTGTITNDDAAPPVGALSIDSVSHNEGDAGRTDYVFTVSRTGGNAGAVSAAYTFAGGTTDAADFLGGVVPANGTVSFADGQTSQTVTVAVAGDQVREADETFSLTLSAPTGGATLGTATGTGGIVNDDDNGALSIAAGSGNEGSDGATDNLISFTVTRAGGTTGPVSATYTVTNGTTDTADFGGTLPSGTVSFAAGETSQVVTVAVTGDTVVEPNETFTVTLSAPTGGATLGTASATGTIVNDDTPPAYGSLAIDSVSHSEGNTGLTDYVFTVTRSGGSDGAVSADYAIVNGTTNAADFAQGALPPGGTVTFAAGETSRTITVSIMGDTTAEANETFSVTLANPVGGVTIGTATGTGTVVNDDDVAPLPNVFINEIHYDNVGTDSNEAIELAGVAGTDLTGYKLVLYNGGSTAAQAASAAVYGTTTLSGVIANQSNGYGTVIVTYPQDGLQNGSPDGVALVAPDGRVIQFLSYEGVLTAASGTPAAGLTSTDIGVSETSGPVNQSLQLTGSGSNYGDFTWQPDAASTYGALNTGQSFLPATGPSTFRVNDPSVQEGNSGTTNLTFTVSRAGGSGHASTIDYQITLPGGANGADANDVVAGQVLGGTLTFAAGVSTQTVTVGVVGDTVGETNETLTLTLSNASTGDVIADASGTGTIVNDDIATRAIYDIQGHALTSPFVGQTVATYGVVTAVDTNGFYLQDPTGDGDIGTSDGILVFTNSAPTVAVGNQITLTGVVTEFVSTTAGSASLTELKSPTNIVVVNASVSTPTPVLIATDGTPGSRTPPTSVIDDDGGTSYDPTTDGFDFYESLEGMLVTVQTPRVVSNTNSFGETYVVASNGVGDTGLNSRSGNTISAGDNNPETIVITKDAGIYNGYTPGHSPGDVLGNVTGVLTYQFAMYELVVTQPVTVTTDVALGRETTNLVGDAAHLSYATFNVENLAPVPDTTPNGNGRTTQALVDAAFASHANEVVNALKNPDIIGLQEIQDADGANGTGADHSGTATANKLIAAIVAAGGPTYRYVEIAPTDGQSTGGEPNGYIHNGFLYNPERVGYVDGSARLLEDPAYAGTRRPLLADFTFNGQTFTAADLHSTSRGGSDPLYGATQPPAQAGDAARTSQGQALQTYITGVQANDPGHKFVVNGDFNGYYYEGGLLALESSATQAGGTGSLTNLVATLLPPEERYSYYFGGYDQLFDNILVSGNLAANAQVDVVHYNAGFTDGLSVTDHDQTVALIDFTRTGAAAAVAVADAVTTSEAAQVRGSVLTNDSGGAGTMVTALNGAATLGTQVRLASGATVTLNADGSYVYNPDGAFSALETGQTGTDTFDYTLAGGSTATVTVTINGVTNAASSTGNDTASGTPGNDAYDYSAGGNDTVSTGAGNDTVFFGAAFTAQDHVDGGSGRDQVGLQGDYSGANALTINANTLTNVEVLALLAPASGGYTVTTVDGVVAAGQTFTVYASELAAANAFTFNGSAETDGKFVVYAGAGVDTITTGAMNDAIYFGRGRFGASDHVDGGAGTDQVALAGSYSGAITGTQLVSIETLVLLDDAQTPALYNVTLAANWASAGNAKTVYLAELHTNAVVDGSAAVSNLTVYGGFGNDTLTGGAGDDIIYGGPGADRLVGGAGADTFAYLSAAHSSGSSYDTIVGFTPGTDKIDLPGLTPVSAVDADTSGAMGGGSLDGALSAALANLQAGHAVQFTVTDGALAGQVFEVVNTHGTTGYQAGQDFVIHLETPAVHITDPGTFI